MDTSYSLKNLFKRLPSSVIYITASAWGGRLITALAQLISIPLSLEYLGAEQYSWWAIALSLQGWWLLCDMGLAVSLQNSISAGRTKNENDANLIVSATVLILPIVLVCILLILIFADQLAQFLLPPTANHSEYGANLIVITGISGLMLTIGNVAYRILYARHKGYWANILPAVGTLFSLVGLVVLNQLHVDEPLLWVAVVWLSPTSLLATGLFILLLVRAFYYSKGSVQPLLCAHLFKQGKQFGLFAVLAAFTLQIDYVVIGKLMSAEDIVLYSIVTKMMAFNLFLFTAVVQAVWPVCAEATTQHKWSEVDQLIWRLVMLGFIIILMGASFMWLFREDVLRNLSASHNLVIPIELWCLLSVYGLVRVWSDSYAMLLQSMGIVSIFLIYVPIQSIISVLGQLIFGSYFGLSGVVIAIILSFVLTAVWILPRTYRLFKHANS